MFTLRQHNQPRSNTPTDRQNLVAKQQNVYRATYKNSDASMETWKDIALAQARTNVANVIREATDGAASSTAVAHQVSFLEKLPPEMRDKVYYYYFDEGNAYEITRGHHFDKKKRCVCKGNSDKIRKITNILQVCKLTYTEAKPILFRNREFIFPCVTSLTSFVHAIVPKDRCLVTKIAFHYCGADGPRGFKMLANFSGLQSLKIKLSMKTEAGMSNVERKNYMKAPGMGSLLKLRGLGSVVLEVDERMSRFALPRKVEELRAALKALKGNITSG